MSLDRCLRAARPQATYASLSDQDLLNGHEYAKRRATAAGIAFTELDNGFATTEDPAGLQRTCDTLTSGTIRVFCERWWARLPLPLTEDDRAAGYWWNIFYTKLTASRWPSSRSGLRISDETGRVPADHAEPAIPPAYQPNRPAVKTTKRDARITARPLRDTETNRHRTWSEAML